MRRGSPECPVLGHLSVQLSTHDLNPQIHGFVHSIRIYY